MPKENVRESRTRVCVYVYTHLGENFPGENRRRTREIDELPKNLRRYKRKPRLGSFPLNHLVTKRDVTICPSEIVPLLINEKRKTGRENRRNGEEGRIVKRNYGRKAHPIRDLRRKVRREYR